MVDLSGSLATRQGAVIEKQERNRTYYRLLVDLAEVDFVEACDRILFTDDWFPTIARIREVTDTCKRERMRREDAMTPLPADTPVVCGTCHGARWIRLGGYDPLLMQAGEDGSRVQRCPDCTTNGVYDERKEQARIIVRGGARLQAARREVDMNSVTWPARMAELRDPVTGRVDMDLLYRLSREMRGLDPDVDERVKPTAGWKTIGDTVRIGANEAAD